VNIADKIHKYERVLEQKKKERDQLQGRLDAELARLKELGFNSVEEAQEFVAKEKARVTELETQLEKDLEEFEATYAEYLS